MERIKFPRESAFAPMLVRAFETKVKRIMIEERSNDRGGPTSTTTGPEADHQLTELIRHLDGLLRTLEELKNDPSTVYGPPIEHWEDGSYRYLEIRLPETPASRGVDLNFFGGRAFVRIER